MYLNVTSSSSSYFKAMYLCSITTEVLVFMSIAAKLINVDHLVVTGGIII